LYFYAGAKEGIRGYNCAGPTSRRDSIVLSILKAEWFGGVREMLEGKMGGEW